VAKLPESDVTYMAELHARAGARIDITKSVAENLKEIAGTKKISDVKIAQLFRPRHDNVVRQLIQAGIKAAYKNESGLWVPSTEWKDNFETHFQKFLAYAKTQIDGPDGTFGVTGESAT
jgi:hypothetical protein